jgi:SAM-dependent methyltransferase
VKNEPVYDRIAKEYQASKQMPFRRCIEEYSLFKLLGNLQGKRVLDLACGEGFYTRKMKARGAGRILGVDISSKMVELAVAQEREQPNACEYMVADVTTLGRLDEFDIVVGVFLLNYARKRDELARFCGAIFENLRPGGSFVGLNDNPANPVEQYGAYTKYGFRKSTRLPRSEGTPITYHNRNPDGTEFCFDNYYLAPATYETVFQEAGFSDFTWCGPWLDPAATQNFEPGFWDLFLAHPPIIGLTARKQGLMSPTVPPG